MLIKTHRPSSFQSMIGSELARKVMSKIARNPNDHAQSLVISGPYGSGKCVAGDTRVHTANGYLKIEDIYKAQLAFGKHFDSEGFCPFETTVYGGFKSSHFFNGGFKDTKIIESSQFRLEATNSHQIKVLQDTEIVWKPFSDLKVNDWVALDTESTILFAGNIRTPEEFALMPNDTYGWFVGLFVSLFFKQKVNILENGSIVLEIDTQILTVLNQILPGLPISKVERKEDTITATFERTISLSLFKSIFPSETHTIPLWIYSTDNKFVKGFVSGWVDSEYSGQNDLLSTGTESLMTELRHLFNLLGLYPDLLPYSNDSFCLEWNIEDYPRLNRLNLLSEKKGVMEFYASQAIEALLEDQSDVVPQIEGFIFSPIEFIKDSSSYVYDLTVPESQAFYANGIINHNTTSARVFAKAVNCESRSGDACNNCKSCLDISSGSFLYQEYDCGTVGDVDNMRKIRDTLSQRPSSTGFKVVVFDEAHLVSKTSQSLLLKILEDTPKGIFYLWVSTDPERILDTIKSRSLEISIDLLTDSELTELAIRVSTKEGIPISSEAISRMVRRVGGHARDVIQQIELFRILGNEEYLSTQVILDDKFRELYSLVVTGDSDNIGKCIESIISYPTNVISQDYSKFLLSKIKENFLIDKTSDGVLDKVVKYSLEYLFFLRTTRDWSIFLYSLSGFSPQKINKESVNLNNRFQASRK